ncbi:hypothetical protein GLOTRDRAFT_94412 [Gloeophyllum trabeum ATCC 11539]|uniref:Uncharacterized protein n=1 Tax=Gloeophyllum trabeum (strain ATCC 11539 / FP-39264 / Madison 617) TaxID=670483 RepID=S7RMV1_GLOTA|nr:uncharacterized protein GLOTRDRAFT_94412 [Gloeophyllum trabeum ATCC 11539]EPQ54014.1 hypothetical protein GLOTRDRAFT_94412 [Gloeophyllum trabeum ATCC 11539]
MVTGQAEHAKLADEPPQRSGSLRVPWLLAGSVVLIPQGDRAGGVASNAKSIGGEEIRKAYHKRRARPSATKENITKQSAARARQKDHASRIQKGYFGKQRLESALARGVGGGGTMQNAKNGGGLEDIGLAHARKSLASAVDSEDSGLGGHSYVEPPSTPVRHFSSPRRGASKVLAALDLSERTYCPFFFGASEAHSLVLAARKAQLLAMPDFAGLHAWSDRSSLKHKTFPQPRSPVESSRNKKIKLVPEQLKTDVAGVNTSTSPNSDSLPRTPLKPSGDTLRPLYSPSSSVSLGQPPRCSSPMFHAIKVDVCASDHAGSALREDSSVNVNAFADSGFSEFDVDGDHPVTPLSVRSEKSGCAFRFETQAHPADNFPSPRDNRNALSDVSSPATFLSYRSGAPVPPGLDTSALRSEPESSVEPLLKQLSYSARCPDLNASSRPAPAHDSPRSSVSEPSGDALAGSDAWRAVGKLLDFRPLTPSPHSVEELWLARDRRGVGFRPQSASPDSPGPRSQVGTQLSEGWVGQDDDDVDMLCYDTPQPTPGWSERVSSHATVEEEAIDNEDVLSQEPYSRGDHFLKFLGDGLGSGCGQDAILASVNALGGGDVQTEEHYADAAMKYTPVHEGHTAEGLCLGAGSSPQSTPGSGVQGQEAQDVHHVLVTVDQAAHVRRSCRIHGRSSRDISPEVEVPSLPAREHPTGTRHSQVADDSAKRPLADLSSRNVSRPQMEVPSLHANARERLTGTQHSHLSDDSVNWPLYGLTREPGVEERVGTGVIEGPCLFDEDWDDDDE